MKSSSFKGVILLTFTIFVCSLITKAQTPVISKTYKDDTIDAAAHFLINNYVFKELGVKAAAHINDLNEKGHFTPHKDLEDFASELTKAIYAVTYDKHISVSLKPENQTNGVELNKWVDSRMDERNYFRLNNANFKTIRKLHGNIGYLELRGFYGLAWGQNFANYAMEMLATSDAIIIDLRSNYGGRGDMVEYLLSHFFEKPIATSKTIKRQGDEFIEHLNYTKEIPGIKKLPKIPLFVLISSNTFSAAEGFSYPLKIHKRALFIGEATKGGANAGDLISLNDKLNIFIPDVSVTHPTKNESWEGIGIKPDIEVRSGDALEIAIELAQDAAEKYKTDNDKKAKTLLIELDSIISNFEANPKNEKISDAYLACREQHLIFEEWEINSLGHQYFEDDKLKTAEALFMANTILYPESPDTFDTYAEILLKSKKTAPAILNYEKAIFLSKKNNTGNLESYKKHLTEAKKKLR